MTAHPAGIAELSDDWRLSRAADHADEDGAQLSSRDVVSGVPIPRMPATILGAQVGAGLYEDDLYLGDALTRIDQDLWREDWWYTLTFPVEAGHERYTLQFDGISYRAEIWLNGTLLAGRDEVVGSWRRFEFDVSERVRPGEQNHLAVLVIPERRTPGLVITDIPTQGRPDGVDLADTWADWLNFHHHGDADAKKTFLPDKNSGVFRRVRLSWGGPLTIRHPYVRTDLPQLAGAPGEVGDSAALTVHADLRNWSPRRVDATVRATILRDDAEVAHVERAISLAPHETLDLVADPSAFPQLMLDHPDLWWPYTWGEPALYELRLSVTATQETTPSDTASLDFGVRHITGHRDDMAAQPQFSDAGSFYLRINGVDFLVRGAAYSPDLFFESNDAARVQRVLAHAKDLGVNLLRWEGHLIDDGLLELCDREGMPVMVGTMCCGAWERWHEWDAEDYDIARRSIADTVRTLRAHPAIALWSNGSDGMPPDEVLGGYRRALEDADWQNAIVDTVSTRNREWSGVHMNGPYTWRAPVYWFLPDNTIATGSCAEEGNNEAVPILSSLKAMLPEESLWPIDEVWAMHAGSMNGQLAVTRKVIERRFGGAESVEEFVQKAQIAQYESARAHMEAYAARGWETNKFTVYWMLNSPWPSFFGHVFDWRWGKGGLYYGLKQGLRPLGATFDYFADGDRETARIVVTNQTRQIADGATVTVSVHRADGSVHGQEQTVTVAVPALGSVVATTLPRPVDAGPIYFVRVVLRDADGDLLSDSTYWQAAEHDVPNLRVIDGIMDAMRVRQFTWPDFSGLLSLPTASLTHELHEEEPAGTTRRFRIHLRNTGTQLAFFVRAELRHAGTEDDILPSIYSENYLCIYPGESREIEVGIDADLLGGTAPDLHLEGPNLG